MHAKNPRASYEKDSLKIRDGLTYSNFRLKNVKSGRTLSHVLSEVQTDREHSLPLPNQQRRDFERMEWSSSVRDRMVLNGAEVADDKVRSIINRTPIAHSALKALIYLEHSEEREWG